MGIPSASGVAHFRSRPPPSGHASPAGPVRDLVTSVCATPAVGLAILMSVSDDAVAAANTIIEFFEQQQMSCARETPPTSPISLSGEKAATWYWRSTLRTLVGTKRSSLRPLLLRLDRIDPRLVFLAGCRNDITDKLDADWRAAFEKCTAQSRRARARRSASCAACPTWLHPERRRAGHPR